MNTVTQTLAAVVIFFAATFGAMQVRDSIANAQDAPNLDAGPATSDIAPTGHPYRDAGVVEAAKPPESVPAAPVAVAGAPDPVADPGGFVDDVRDQWRSGAYAGAVLLALYGLLYLVQKRTTWLDGRAAFYTAVAMTFLTACAEAVARGSTPNFNVIIGAAAVAIGILIKGPAKASDPA